MSASNLLASWQDLLGRSEEEINMYLDELSWSRIATSLTDKITFTNMEKDEDFTLNDLITCPFCLRFLEEPITLFCGCTCCKICRASNNVILNPNSTCTKCGKRIPEGPKKMKNNVSVCSLLKKWFATEVQGIKLRMDGEDCYARQEFGKALQIYDEALRLFPGDHVAWKNQAQVLFQSGRTEEALASIEKCLLIKPLWDQAFLLKAQIILKLGHNYDAVVALLFCLTLEHDNTEATKLLNDIILGMLKLRSNSYATDFQAPSFANGEDIEMKSVNFRLESATTGDLAANPLNQIFQRFVQEANSLNRNGKQLRTLFTDDKLSELECELECNLCSRLIYEPVTTPCGHLFCKECIRRWLDHNHKCPLCRFSLFEYISLWEFEMTSLICRLTRAIFPKKMEELKENHELVMRKLASIATDTENHIPIFVCSNTLPTRPLRLQIFEPRYRLMLRQCLESGSRQFGMCAYSSENDFAEYGNMVEVKNVYFVPDGRAFVECYGGRRFKVIARGTQDGYNTAKVKWIKDSEIGDEKLDYLTKLNVAVYDEMKTFVFDFLRRHDSYLSNQIQLPNSDCENLNSRDGPSWIWWAIDCFVASERQQISFIAMDSVEERLSLIRKHLELPS